MKRHFNFGSRGVILFETLFLLGLLLGGLVLAELGVLRQWIAVMRNLQDRRLVYDGRLQWER